MISYLGKEYFTELEVEEICEMFEECEGCPVCNKCSIANLIILTPYINNNTTLLPKINWKEKNKA